MREPEVSERVFLSETEREEQGSAVEDEDDTMEEDPSESVMPSDSFVELREKDGPGDAQESKDKVGDGQRPPSPVDEDVCGSDGPKISLRKKATTARERAPCEIARSLTGFGYYAYRK